MESHVHDLHLPVQGEGEHEVVVGPVHLEEFERSVLDLGTLLLVRHLQAGDVLAHLHQDVVQAAGVDIDLFHQVADLPYEAERVAFQFFHGVGHLGRWLGVPGQEPDHQLFRRVMV